MIVKEKPTMRCCIYKERAIVEERIKRAMGGDTSNPNVIEVIDIACDECPVSGYKVSEACRAALLKASKNVLPGKFIEGMACEGGCIGGAGCLTHGPKNWEAVEKYGSTAGDKSMTDAISALK